jgi:hypothetical protein
MAHSIMTLSIMTLSIMTLSIIALSMMTICIMTLSMVDSITKGSIFDTHQNVMLGVAFLIVMLRVIMLYVIMLRGALFIVMLSVIMLYVVAPKVAAPLDEPAVNPRTPFCFK